MYRAIITFFMGIAVYVTISCTNQSIVIAYKPFLSAHNTKFSVGDFNNSNNLFAIHGHNQDILYRYRIDIQDSTLNSIYIESGNFILTDIAYIGLDMPYSKFVAIQDNSSINISVSIILDNQIIQATSVALTKTSFKEIYSWRGLQNMQENLDAHYILMDNIQFPAPGEEGLPSTGFIPIGAAVGGSIGDTDLENFYSIKHFTGSFNGNNYTISDFYINNLQLRTGGLFARGWGVADFEDEYDFELGHTVKVYDLVFENPTVLVKDTAGIVFASLFYGLVSNVIIGGSCTVVSAGTINDANPDIATGTIAARSSHSYIQDVSVTCELSSQNRHVGGIVGYSNEDIVSGIFKGSVQGTHSVGGLVGLGLEYSEIYGYAVATVQGTSYVGGLVGAIIGGGGVWGYAIAEVTGNDRVGGLIGNAAYTKVYGYTEGMVLGIEKVGGIFGEINGVSGNVYTSAIVKGSAYVGGITGFGLSQALLYSHLHGYTLGYVKKIPGKQTDDIGSYGIGWGFDPFVVHHDEEVLLEKTVRFYAGRTQEEHMAERNAKGKGDHVGSIGKLWGTIKNRDPITTYIIEGQESRQAQSFEEFVFGNAAFQWRQDARFAWPILNFPKYIPYTQLPFFSTHQQNPNMPIVTSNFKE